MGIKSTQKTIAVADIKAEWAENSRSEVGDLTGLKESIESTGIQQPVGVQEMKDGSYRLIFGFRRFTCATELGLEEIPAVVYGTRLKKAHRFLLNLQENVARDNLNPMDEAKAAKRLIDEGLAEEDIIAGLGWSKTLFTQRIKLLGYSDDLQAAIAEDRITVQQAAKIAELPEEQQERFIDIASTLTVGKLKDMVDKELGDGEDGGEDPELPDDDGEGGDEGADGEDGEDGGEDGEDEDAVDPAAIATNIVTALCDLGVSELDEEDAAKVVIQARSIEWSALSVDDLTSVESLLGKFVERFECAGAFEEAAGDEDDAEGEEPEGDEDE